MQRCSLRGIESCSGEVILSQCFLPPFLKGVYSKRKEFAPKGPWKSQKLPALAEMAVYYIEYIQSAFKPRNPKAVSQFIENVSTFKQRS